MLSVGEPSRGRIAVWVWHLHCCLLRHLLDSSISIPPNYPTGSTAASIIGMGDVWHLHFPLLSFPHQPDRCPQTSFEAEDNINVRLRSGTGGSASYGGLKPGSMLGNLLQVRMYVGGIEEIGWQRTEAEEGMEDVTDRMRTARGWGFIAHGMYVGYHSTL